jgi:hypothetical protein
MQTSKEERSLGELFADLARESSTLIRQEVGLAKVELTEKASRLGKDLGFLAIGGAVAYAGFLGIMAGVIIVLAAAGLPWWLAALLVGLALAGGGYLLVQRGLTEMRREDLAPRQTMESLRENTQWAKEQVK